MAEKEAEEGCWSGPEDHEEEEAGINAVVGEFIVKQTGQHSNVVFIPDGWPLNHPQLKKLFTGRWQLDAPGMMISIDAGTVHPKQFASRGLVNLPSFETFWAAATMQAENQGGQTDEVCGGHSLHPRDP